MAANTAPVMAAAAMHVAWLGSMALLVQHNNMLAETMARMP